MYCPIQKSKGETLALTTVQASLGLPPYAKILHFWAANNFRLSFGPSVLKVIYYDASNAAGARYEHTGTTANALTRDLTDRDTATGTGTAMDSGTTSDYLYVGLAYPTAGLRVVIGAANSGAASALTVEYRKNDGTWNSVGVVTDGTADGGVTLAITGSATWTLPTDWLNASLADIDANAGAPGDYLFWLRLSWSVALDIDTEVDEIWALSEDANYGYYLANERHTMLLDRRIAGSVVSLVDAGTSTLNLTYLAAAG